MVYDSWLAGDRDQIVMDRFGLGRFVGVIDHSSAYESLYAYQQVILALYVGWSYVTDVEETQDLISDLFNTNVRARTTTEIDVLIPLLCVSCWFLLESSFTIGLGRKTKRRIDIVLFHIKLQ